MGGFVDVLQGFGFGFGALGTPYDCLAMAGPTLSAAGLTELQPSAKTNRNRRKVALHDLSFECVIGSLLEFLHKWIIIYFFFFLGGGGSGTRVS